MFQGLSLLLFQWEDRHNLVVALMWEILNAEICTCILANLSFHWLGNGYGPELQLQNGSFTHSVPGLFLLGSEESYFRRYGQTGERGWP